MLHDRHTIHTGGSIGPSDVSWAAWAAWGVRKALAGCLSTCGGAEFGAGGVHRARGADGLVRGSSLATTTGTHTAVR